jgi:hypothetical protein
MSVVQFSTVGRIVTMSNQDLLARASQIFSMNGGSWRDYALVADIDPPRIVRALPSMGLLDIADEALAEACRHYLTQQGAQIFASFDELSSAFGIRPAANDGMATYSSPAGFYAVDHPADWRIYRDDSDENILNIRAPEGSGEVTISAFHGNGVSPLAVRGLFDRVFKSYEVVCSLRAISQNNWDGLYAEYLQSVDGGFRSWLVIGACYGKTLVLITANDTEEAMLSKRPVYEAVLYSLILADPDAAR